MKTLWQNLRFQASLSPPQRVSVAVTSILLGFSFSPWATAQQADPACGNPFVTTFGPHDYLVVHGQQLKIVEDYHFTRQVESLISGTSSSLGGDIDYTLRAFPNHHRALISMMNLGARLKSPQPAGAHFSVECYFKRALLFRPDDVIARMIFAKYLASNRRTPEAIAELVDATKRSPKDGFTQYNAGLIYFEMGEFGRALVQAHRAIRLGFERPELKQKLQSAGKWVDETPIEAAAAASSADAAVTSAASAANAASEPPR